jgi:hypothetical protein
LAAPWFNIPRDQADAAGMLAHLHGHFVGADLLYDDEYAALGMSPLFAFVTDEGVVSNHWPSGATWVQAPGYGLGLLAGRVLAALGVGKVDALGVVPLLGVRAWAMVVLVACARFVFRWFRRAGGSASAGVVAVVCIVFGTPLFHYASEAPLRPHLWGFAITLAFTALWATPGLASASHGPGTRAVALGALAGLATAIRPQLGVLVLLVVYDAWGDADGRWRRIALGVLAFSAWPLLHLRVQIWMYGPELLEFGRGASHHLYAFLLSPHHGVLTWCPVLVLAFAAVVLAPLGQQRGAVLLAAIVVQQLWLDSGMRDIEPYRVLGTRTWAGGMAFGPRKLVDVLPLLLPAAVWLVAEARRRGLQRWLAALALALCVPTILLHAAAFVAPEATTGSILDGRALLELIGLAFDGEAWSAALRQRDLPLAVPLVVGGIVAVPLALGIVRVAASARGLEPLSAVRIVAVAVLLAAVFAHLWSTVLQVRSDAMLMDDPQRMQQARARMHPAHEATVARIPAHHATLKAILGDSAAP